MAVAELEAARAALTRAAWAEARAGFEAALAEEETVEALLGLGTAARWGSYEAETALTAHERAYRLARSAGDDHSAAAAALELAFDCEYFRGPAEANGWLERAGHLLARVEPSEEHAMLLYLRATRLLYREHDPAAAAELARAASAAARESGSGDTELVAVALEGLALVAAGTVREGMARLDEAAAAAMAGEIADVRLVEVVCCHVIEACKRVRDFERAGEWCGRVEVISKRFDDAEMFATCRMHYADVLLWRCSWDEAEQTLASAARELERLSAKSGQIAVRLAELRRRQGRFGEAEALLQEAGGRRHTALVRAGIALDRGDARRAVDEAEAFLRRTGPADRSERVHALELLVCALLELEERDGAARAAAELDEIATALGTTPLRAAALVAHGRLQTETEPAAARAAFENAIDLFDGSGAAYDAARARLALAAVLRALGHGSEARREEDAARSILTSLDVPAPVPAPDTSLTRREREVLKLVAAGRSNEEIAAQLVLSVRTVERHVANIYGKIGASGRNARAAAVAYALTRGTT